MVRQWTRTLIDLNRTLGCRLYFRLLPVVARELTLDPESGPEDDVMCGELSSLGTAVMCSTVGPTATVGCDLSLR
jgi:hypothetical protein